MTTSPSNPFVIDDLSRAQNITIHGHTFKRPAGHKWFELDTPSLYVLVGTAAGGFTTVDRINGFATTKGYVAGDGPIHNRDYHFKLSDPDRLTAFLHFLATN